MQCHVCPDDYLLRIKTFWLAMQVHLLPYTCSHVAEDEQILETVWRWNLRTS